MKFKPLENRALVKLVEREEQIASGIVLPDTAKKKPQTAEVVAVGSSRGRQGQRRGGRDLSQVRENQV